MSSKADESISKRLEEIWNSRSPQKRIEWITGAGYFAATATKYKDFKWSDLPSYIKNTLEDQER